MIACYTCGTNKKLFSDGSCQVCGGYGLNTACFSTSQDYNLLFQESDKVEIIDPAIRMSKLLVIAGVFQSIGEADRNGWKDKKLSYGWTDIHVGKRPKTTRICIWNPKEVIDV